ncbi:MAG: hypothetical protein P8J37_16120 [Fuerstiella sp.]|nr:hypothetical protein [Fuerstiella sp.]
MNETRPKPQRWAAFANNYGMVLVLLILIAAFSVLTLERQSSTGADAGRVVARDIVNAHGSSSTVVVVAGLKPPDESFLREATDALEAAGVTVAATVGGRPADARRAIERVLQEGHSIDAIAATGDAARWSIYDRFESVGNSRCVSAAPTLWPTFAKSENILNVANQTAIYAIIAIGMTMVIITAGIDLSVGSLVALSAVAAAVFIRDAGDGTETGAGLMIVGCCVGMGICALGGVFNGVMITRLGIPPFITTLAMMLMARGLARRLSDELSIQALPASFTWIGGAATFGIPNPVFLMVVLYGVAHVVMSRTVFGRYAYAVGGNAEAARLSGVPVKRVIVVVYTLCGALAGLGGIVQSSKLGSGDPKLGLMFELDVIAAVVVGGTSLMGGEGRIFGTLIGAFIIAVIKNGMNLMKVGAPEQQIVLGAVVLLAVLVDTLKRRGTAH